MKIALKRLLVVFLLALGQFASADERPNIVFAFADDYGRYASCYAPHDREPTVNSIIHTPNIDRVAGDGVLFLNAYVNAPSCTPCRSSLLSGQYFWRTGRGAILLGAEWDDSIPTYPLLLRDSGYHIGKTLKVWSPGRPRDAPYGGNQHNYQSAGGGLNGFSQLATRMVAGGNSFADSKQKVFDQVRENFKTFLTERKEGQPFCYWFGPTNCHRSWTAGSGKALWGIDPDSLKGKLPEFLPDVPEVRQDFADYLGECLAFDASVGVMVDELKKCGEWENTIFVISGDHGAPGFPRGKCNLYDFGTHVTLAISGPGVKGGRVVSDFTTLPDLAATFLDVGQVEVPKVMTARSLMPVLESNKQGLVDPTRTFAITGRERHVDTANEGKKPYPQRAIRTADYLYIHNFEPDRWPMGMPVTVGKDGKPITREQVVRNTRATFADFDASPTRTWLWERSADPEWSQYYDWAFGKRPKEELYHLASDPNQVKNVAQEDEHKASLVVLRKQLMRVLEETNDPRITKDPVPFEQPPFTN